MAESKECKKTKEFRPWCDDEKNVDSMSPALLTMSPMTSPVSSPSTSRSSSPNPTTRNSFHIDNLLRSEPPKKHQQQVWCSSDTESQRSDSVGSAEDFGGRFQPANPSGHYHQVPVTGYDASWPCCPTTPGLYPAAYYPTPVTLPVDYSPLPFDFQQAVQRLRQQEAEVKQARRSRPKKFSCPHPGCINTFSNKGQLKGHYRIHTGERPFKCTWEKCGKDFTRNEELTRHKRIHEGLKPYPCLHCGKPFGRKDHLKKHTKTHERALVAEAQRNYAAVYHMAAAGYQQQYQPSF